MTTFTTLSTDRDDTRRHAGRDDLFTHIHKALRLALFDVAVRAGRCDWEDPAEVSDLLDHWRPLLTLLRSHAEHEDDHLVRPLDGVDAVEAARIDDQHRHLEDLLDHVATSMSTAAATADAVDGLAAYRDLNRFIAEYLPHLHEEETVVMPRIWDARSDDEIAMTRAAFMATLTPEIARQSVELMMQAVDPATRTALAARIAAAPRDADGLGARASQGPDVAG